MLGKLLKEHHISRSSLAYKLNVTLQTVHNWCSGRIVIPSQKMAGVCDALESFGVPKEQLTKLTLDHLHLQGLPSARIIKNPNDTVPTIMLIN